MWKEIPNSPLICIEKKKKNLIGYAVECIRPDGKTEARSCVFNTKTKKFTHFFISLESLDAACTAVEVTMKIHRVFTDED